MNAIKSLLRKFGLMHKSNPLYIKVYRDKDLHFRWRLTRSGRTVGDSGEGYINLQDCESTLASTIQAMNSGNVIYESVK